MRAVTALMIVCLSACGTSPALEHGMREGTARAVPAGTVEAWDEGGRYINQRPVPLAAYCHPARRTPSLTSFFWLFCCRLIWINVPGCIPAYFLAWDRRPSRFFSLGLLPIPSAAPQVPPFFAPRRWPDP